MTRNISLGATRLTKPGKRYVLMSVGSLCRNSIICGSIWGVPLTVIAKASPSPTLWKSSTKVASTPSSLRNGASLQTNDFVRFQFGWGRSFHRAHMYALTLVSAIAAAIHEAIGPDSMRPIIPNRGKVICHV